MTDMGEITRMIGECAVCRVGMQSQGKIYVVPITALGSGTLGATAQVFEGFGEITAIGATLR